MINRLLVNTTNEHIGFTFYDYWNDFRPINILIKPESYETLDRFLHPRTRISMRTREYLYGTHQYIHWRDDGDYFDPIVSEIEMDLLKYFQTNDSIIAIVDSTERLRTFDSAEFTMEICVKRTVNFDQISIFTVLARDQLCRMICERVKQLVTDAIEVQTTTGC